jgi:hypothetical protein
MTAKTAKHAKLAGEDLITLGEAAELIPARREGRPVHAATLYRYTKSGFQGTLLESVRVFGKRMTSRAAVTRFLAALVDERPPGGPAPKTPSRGRPRPNARRIRQRRKGRDARELEAAGIIP